MKLLLIALGQVFNAGLNYEKKRMPRVQRTVGFVRMVVCFGDSESIMIRHDMDAPTWMHPHLNNSL
jgi:hypothetical protein